MTGRIVSLRESMDRLEARDSLFHHARQAFLDALNSMERHLFRIYPDKLNTAPPNFDTERQSLSKQPNSPAFQSAGRRLDRELQAIADLIRNRLAGAVELTEVVVLLDATTQSLRSGSAAREESIQDVARQLDAASKLETVDEFRAHILSQIQSLGDIVQSMRAENLQLVCDLEREMVAYRRQLDQASLAANRDPLTGLGNRRTLESGIQPLVDAAIPFCLVLIDFNRFKFINDQFGHLAGDELLRSFSQRLAANLRTDDIAVRWGGDEFVVLLPIPLHDAMRRAGSFQNQLAGDYRLTVAGQNFRVNLQFTTAVADHKPGESIEHILSRADSLLYSQKSVSA